MGKHTYLDIEWTTAQLDKRCMDVVVRNNGAGDFESITIPDEMRSWLYRETGEVQSSYIMESQWWWDKVDLENKTITFFFRDPSVALKFKLSWGGVHAISS